MGGEGAYNIGLISGAFTPSSPMLVTRLEELDICTFVIWIKDLFYFF